MKGPRRKLPVSRPLVPSWDLLVIFDALSHNIFEFVEGVGLTFLSLKTALITNHSYLPFLFTMGSGTCSDVSVAQSSVFVPKA